MKRLLAMLLVFMLPWTAFADALPAFTGTLQALSDAEFARQCESALADTNLGGSAVAKRDGVVVLARSRYEAFLVMRRPDGLLMLCHFLPAGEELALHWHNDLLLSYYQDVALSVEGAVWSDGMLPELRMITEDKLEIRLYQRDGTQLALMCEGFIRESWRVTQMALHVSPDGMNWHAALTLPEDCLAEDIYLATCVPGDWCRGEQEEAWYGW